MSVPVRNVYYMLLYAWKLIGVREAVEVSEAGHTELQDLFAHVLADLAGPLLARGLDRGYVTRTDVVGGIRGKLALGETLKGGHLASARTLCSFDDMEYDVLHNRILKATLRRLLTVQLEAENRTRIQKLYRKMDVVPDVDIALRDFGRVQLHRNNGLYETVLRICELIFDHLMVDPRTGTARFRKHEATPQQMGKLFQEFVRAFIEREARGLFEVRSPHIQWHGQRGSPAALDRLPRMETDIVLENANRRIILDTKFYAEAFAGRFTTKKLIAEHLYQIFAYVVNRDAEVPGLAHEGMLLYPVVKAPFAFDYELMGRRFAVRSLQLDQPWEQIRTDLLHLLQPA